MMDVEVHWIVAHLATIGVAVLTVVFLARILRDRRAQGSTLAWILAVVVVPYIGIPLYLVVGSRKRSSSGKRIALSTAPSPDETPIAKLLMADGASAPSDGNVLTLLDTGESAFTNILERIEAAERSIFVTTFILGNDEAGNAIVDRLTARASNGVMVRLLLDGLFVRRANRDRLLALERAGGKVATFGPLLHLPFRGSDNLRNHRKIMVFDESTALVGGMNLALEYMGPRPLETRWCDLSALVHGPAASIIADVFRADWQFITKELLPDSRGKPLGSLTAPPDDARAGTTRLQVVPSGPDAAADGFYDAILAACYAATKRIWVATPYFVPDEALTRALAAAARRGVEVIIIVPIRSNHLLADLAGGTALRTVAAAGGRIATFPKMIHAKAVLVDEMIAVVGSANFDMRSLFLDYEISVFAYSKETIADLAAWFEARLRSSGELAPATALRSFGEDVGRLIAPLV